MPNQWIDPPRNLISERNIATHFGLHPVTARLLVNRGITTVQQTDKFLHPSWDDLNDPFLLHGMAVGAAIVADGVRNRRKFFVHGDYDVDGVTSTTIYVRALRSLGVEVDYHIPLRHGEGYDLRNAGVDLAIQSGADILVTTDCGIQAHAAVDYARSRGLCIVVTDHHPAGRTLPNAHAVINPQCGDTYPLKQIAGVAVAFKTMQAVVRLVCPDEEVSFSSTFLDMVACGTIADVMPLIGENRAMVTLGLHSLAETRKAGVKMLVEGLGEDLSRGIRAETISWKLAPQINAVGRLADAKLVAELFLTEDSWKAMELAGKVDEYNDQRKLLQAKMVDEALAQIVEQPSLVEGRVIVLSKQDWSHGIMGVVAGKICELFGKPTIVIGIDPSGRYGVGSARSVPGFSVGDAVRFCAPIVTGGGHDGAAGLSLEMENFPQFLARLQEYQPPVSDQESVVSYRRIVHDGELTLTDLCMPLLYEFDCLEPCGEGNPSPLFSTFGLVVLEAKTMGTDKSHLKLKVRQGEVTCDCVSFGNGKLVKEFSKGTKIDLLYRPNINRFRGQETIQLMLEDYQKSDA